MEDLLQWKAKFYAIWSEITFNDELFDHCMNLYKDH